MKEILDFIFDEKTVICVFVIMTLFGFTGAFFPQIKKFCEIIFKA